MPTLAFAANSLIGNLGGTIPTRSGRQSRSTRARRTRSSVSPRLDDVEEELDDDGQWEETFWESDEDYDDFLEIESAPTINGDDEPSTSSSMQQRFAEQDVKAVTLQLERGPRRPRPTPTEVLTEAGPSRHRELEAIHRSKGKGVHHQQTYSPIRPSWLAQSPRSGSGLIDFLDMDSDEGHQGYAADNDAERGLGRFPKR